MHPASVRGRCGRTRLPAGVLRSLSAPLSVRHAPPLGTQADTTTLGPGPAGSGCEDCVTRSGGPPGMADLRRVRVLLAYRQDLRQKGDELLDQLRVEARARLAPNQLDGILDGPGLLVGAHRRQRIEHVCDRSDAAHERDLLSLEAPMIARPVPFLM